MRVRECACVSVYAVLNPRDRAIGNDGDDEGEVVICHMRHEASRVVSAD